MTQCHAEQSYLLNEPQRQRLSLEAMLGETSPSWIVAGAIIEGVTSLARFHEALTELARAYPALRTTFVTTGPAESWHQYIRSCGELWRSQPPVVSLPAVTSWADLTDALQGELEGRNPDYRYAAAYGVDEGGCLRVLFAFDHMAFDIRSIDVVLAHLARTAGGHEAHSSPRACRCGSNEFANYVRRTSSVSDRQQLPERYEWALELMLAARSPHAYVALPVVKPLSVMDAAGARRIRSRFVTDASKRHSYTPFAAFASALALGLDASFQSPAMFYTPTLGREAAEMESVGWFADTPIMPVPSSKIKSSVAAERILDDRSATSEAMAATTQTMREGQALTTVVHRKLSTALGGRVPFMDCTADSLPYIVLGYIDRVRQRAEWTAKDVVVRRARLPIAASAPALVPPGYILIRLFREKKAEWSVEVDYETERYESGTMETLVPAMERYLRQLL